METTELPRIIYIADVPVEYSSSGGLFMHRLFENYSSDKLLIIQNKKPDEHLCLKGVQYEYLKRSWIHRLKKTRFHKLAQWAEIIVTLNVPYRIKNLITAFKPDAIVTVAHNLSWILSFKISKKYQLPLHIILHDNILLSEYKGQYKRYLNSLFAEVFKHAYSKFCISPYMQEYYESLYGVETQLLFPFKGKNDQQFQIEVKDKPSLVFAYAGSLYTGDYLPMLNSLAKLMEQKGHKLQIYCSLQEHFFKNYAYLTMPHVSLCKFDDREEVNKQIYETADVTILLSSFEALESSKLNFSSKIVDYCLVAKPVLIVAAIESGISRWAKKNGYRGLINDLDDQTICRELNNFEVFSYRRKLAEEIVLFGKTDFSYEKNFLSFTEQIKEAG